MKEEADKPVQFGVVQRSESQETRDGHFLPWTEWLSHRDPEDWTRNPAEALVFLGDAQAHTGYEVAQAFADRLNAASGTTKHHACVRSAQRPAKEPPMPALRHQVQRRGALAEDWHGRAPNCGVI